LDNVDFDEVFKDCPYNELLQVSQYGRVKDKSTDKILPQTIENNCLRVMDPRGEIEYFTGPRNYEWVHRLVALTWLQNVPNYGSFVHHINDNGFDNRIDNLQWVSKEEHQKIHGYK
jgi:hypothetical protein